MNEKGSNTGGSAKSIFWAILLLLLIAFFATGCKPAQIITERVTVDSTAVLKLQSKVDLQEKTIEALTTDLKRVREENVLLRSESSSHKIDYDTGGQVNPGTGEYPKQSETITHSKYEYDRVVTENETLRKEFNLEAELYETKISNLELTVEALTQENSELQTKDIPRFHFKSFLWGIAAGILILLILVIFLKR